jgi:hypothetical protein
MVHLMKKEALIPSKLLYSIQKQNCGGASWPRSLRVYLSNFFKEKDKHKKRGAHELPFSIGCIF